MKQITIYDLLPVLKRGWVSMDKDGQWWWFRKKPTTYLKLGCHDNKKSEWSRLNCFNIAPFDGDWKDSLIKIDHFHQQGKMVKEEE